MPLKIALSLIHVPREGCDIDGIYSLEDEEGFQFTHPARGATLRYRAALKAHHCFNSRTPRGVRPQMRTSKNY